MRHLRILTAPLCTALFSLLLVSGSALAATIICIDKGSSGDRYLNNGEGYYRANFPGAVIYRGSDLATALGQVAAGDVLIIVAHANQGFFNWGGTSYAGFSGGRNASGTAIGGGIQPFHLPSNFDASGLNITTTVMGCYSATPGAQGTSVATSLQAALAVGAPAVSGSTGPAQTYRGDFAVAGGNGGQRNQAQRCLQSAAVAADPGNPNSATGVRRWLAQYPPANSPITPNAQTVASQAIASASCPSAGGAVTVTLNYTCAPAAPAAQCDSDVECASAVTPTQSGSWGQLKVLYR